MNVPEKFKNVRGLDYDDEIYKLVNICRTKIRNNDKTIEDDKNNLLNILIEYSEWREWAREDTLKQYKEMFKKSNPITV